MDKYSKFARVVALTIRDCMNLFYKYREAELFRKDLLNHLSSLHFSAKHNSFILPGQVNKGGK
jgi:hypothetical protein